MRAPPNESPGNRPGCESLFEDNRTVVDGSTFVKPVEPPMIRRDRARDLCREECAKILAVIAEWRELKAERQRRGKR